MLFAIYIDVLLLQLGTSGLGCYIDNVFLGALGYADDIVIMSPSIRGLNEMIRVCESYADEYSLLFNEQKTVAIKFGDNFYRIAMSYLMESRLNGKKKLGNIISSTLSDAPDCALKRSQFISFVNKMIGNYRNVHTDILCRLFGTYCCSFYGSELWGCNSTGFSRIVTEWHKAVRRVIQLPYCTHLWLLGPLSGQCNIIEQLYCKTVRFIVHGMNHTNPIVKLICKIALTSARSPVGANMAFLRCKYGADFDTSVHTLLNCINVHHELDESL